MYTSRGDQNFKSFEIESIILVKYFTELRICAAEMA